MSHILQATAFPNEARIYMHIFKHLHLKYPATKHVNYSAGQTTSKQSIL